MKVKLPLLEDNLIIIWKLKKIEQLVQKRFLEFPENKMNI